jgi:hypothetical protein
VSTRLDAITDEPLSDTECSCGNDKLDTALYCVQCADELGLIPVKGDKRDKQPKPSEARP